MELLKIHFYKSLLFFCLLVLYSCNDYTDNANYQNNNYNDSLIWYNNDGSEKKVPGYIDFINDTGFYKNHTSIIGNFPYGPTTMQVFDTAISKKVATTMFLGYIYSSVVTGAKYYKQKKADYLNKNFNRIYEQSFYLADESVYLRGNNSLDSWEFFLTTNNGQPNDPEITFFNFSYTNDTLKIYMFSKNGDTLSTEKRFIQFNKLISLNL